MGKYRDELVKDADIMEDAMCRVAGRCDIWQDRLIYALCKTVYDIIQVLLREHKETGHE